MKEVLSKIILICADILSLLISITITLLIRNLFQAYFTQPLPHEIGMYPLFLLLSSTMIIIFILFRMYHDRMDFWQEAQLIFKGLVLTCLIVLSLLAMTHTVQEYSRFMIIISFLGTLVIIPLQKSILKRFLFRIGLWKKEAIVIGQDHFFSKHVFTNPYLGYVLSRRNQAKTLFIASSYTQEGIEQLMRKALVHKQEVIFVPIIKNYDFTRAHIIQLSNARSNLIIVENNLLNRTNRAFKVVLDYMLSLMLLPCIFPLLLIIAYLIKKEESHSPVFFQQKRLGKNAKEFTCYKFRSMRENSENILKDYLIKHPEEEEHYKLYHKYKNDPRLTKIGNFLRKSSLDELPQILNVIKGDMSLIGPRPYMLDERPKIGNNTDMILVVKPGITGLWQVSGRNDVNFKSRIEMDIWYVRNWSFGLDIQILFKTILVVLGQKGSY
ncbi:exopolysaccharide biosynthesis polyprenyl glycosylphosphotransferase [Sulfurospirillum diekertiae]|uniref:Exopolysaccharide biosynthesis polyprenyl glycosylphosphotransferase n=1 Tax=Sulfurospirillum diekertiae TaxID=1854492 RepID=A0A6G9VRA6_9BACT|nr:exopolysaccharide biosynthesis polyprenyl glycosylphosphotransferase [Sulfurospirillum diekertiae]QIR75437.1 exopolysaccharide biosynthesis polyprenyl glycosylphosphotransferase [Sulfurospirillum diekertiae]QIR78086.1 exopolysaccharide biosynthesis polyprenyl glycosylphosphotransferase [Sulfurospirillum diekertiae]